LSFVGVDAHVIDALDTGRYHVLNGVAAASTDTNDLDNRVFGV
jgi:hypothetical protein